MDITLTPDLEAFVQERIKSGQYRDASEVMQDALRSLERESAYESPELEAMILEGLESPSKPLTAETLERIRNDGRKMS